jgi:hypothetical protein
VALAWLVLGIIGVLVRPAATRRAGTMLLNSEGLTSPASRGGGVTVEGDATA